MLRILLLRQDRMDLSTALALRHETGDALRGAAEKNARLAGLYLS